MFWTVSCLGGCTSNMMKHLRVHGVQINACPVFDTLRQPSSSASSSGSGSDAQPGAARIRQFKTCWPGSVMCSTYSVHRSGNGENVGATDGKVPQKGHCTHRQDCIPFQRWNLQHLGIWGKLSTQNTYHLPGTTWQTH